MFQNEKIAETQQKLSALAHHVQAPSSKSVLIQTVALTEALLTRIKHLQSENEKLIEKKNNDEEDNRTAIKKNDELVLALEHFNTKHNILLSEKQEIVNQAELLKQENSGLKHQIEASKDATEKKEETHRKVSSMASKVEEDLRREVNSLNQKLNSTIAGHKSESEMYEEALLKVTIISNTTHKLWRFLLSTVNQFLQEKSI